MSYSHGIGNLQQLLGVLVAVPAADTQRTDPATIATGLATPGYTGVPGSHDGDTIQFSTASNLLGQAVGATDSRYGSVLLQRTVADGTYKISSLDVASKLFDSLLG